MFYLMGVTINQLWISWQKDKVNYQWGREMEMGGGGGGGVIRSKGVRMGQMGY